MDENAPHFDDTVVIHTSKLTKAFGNLVAVNDLHLQVMRGDIFGFLGPNGSGKTTTIGMLLGLIRPTAGRATLFGMDTAHQLPAILQRVGAIVETPMFYPFLTGRDNLRTLGATSGMQQGRVNNHRFDEVLEIVDLRSYEQLIYRKYSTGMKQRLGIAAALLTDPELILLDEPTNGLDPVGVIEIRLLLKRLAELGKTIFLSSHILHEVQQICNRVAILQKGNLIKQGTVDDLLRSAQQIEVHMNRQEDTRAALHIVRQAQERGANWIKGANIWRNQEQELILLVDAARARSADINALLARQQLFASEILPREGSLEQVFLQLTTTPASVRAGIEALLQDPSSIPRALPAERETR